MEFISSIFNIAKNVAQAERQLKNMKEKLTFHIKKGENALLKFKKHPHKLVFIGENLQGRLRDAQEKLDQLENVLKTSQQKTESISLTDKIKFSLPFNTFRDKISHAIEDLRQATEQVINNPLSQQTGKKNLLESPHQPQVDQEIEDIYQMGPTIQENNALDFVMQKSKNATVELTIQAIGPQEIIKVLSPNNKLTIVEKTLEKESKQQMIELFQLGRMNFKVEYKKLKPIYPEIDTISKLSHFKIIWKRNIAPETALKPVDHCQTNDISLKSSEKGDMLSVKKEEKDVFFTVENNVTQASYGSILLEKEKRTLYKYKGAKWVKMEEDTMELINGEQVAVILNKEGEPDLSFKINYKFK